MLRHRYALGTWASARAWWDHQCLALVLSDDDGAGAWTALAALVELFGLDVHVVLCEAHRVPAEMASLPAGEGPGKVLLACPELAAAACRSAMWSLPLVCPHNKPVRVLGLWLLLLRLALPSPYTSS